MGIYSDENVYGVCWKIYGLSDEIIKNFEKTYPAKMNLDQIQEIQTEYEKLTETERNGARFSFYTCCSSTYEYGTKTYMSWFPTNKNDLEDFFVNGHFAA